MSFEEFKAKTPALKPTYMRKKKCFNCKQYGHFWRKCPQPLNLKSRAENYLNKGNSARRILFEICEQAENTDTEEEHLIDDESESEKEDAKESNYIEMADPTDF